MPTAIQRARPERNTIILEDESLKRGFVQLPKLILHARNLSRDAKLLYAILLGYAWEEECCFPGYQRLCYDMQGSENAVRKYMEELQLVGLVSQKRRGLGLTNIYILHEIRTAKLEVLEPFKPEVAEPAQTAGELETERKRNNDVFENVRAQSLDVKEARSNQVKPDQATAPPDLSGSTDPWEDDSGDGDRANSMRLGSTLKRRQLPPKPDAVTQQGLTVLITSIAEDLGDQSPVQSSVGRAYNLYLPLQEAMPIREYLNLLHQARFTTRERLSQVRSDAAPQKPMAYFFGIVEKWTKELAPSQKVQ